MQVAVISVQMVEGAVDEVVDVAAVRYGGVSAARPVAGGALDGGAGVRMALVHLENVLLHAVGVR